MSNICLNEKMQSIEQIFQIINDYQQLNFSHCLKIILMEKEITIPNLHKKLLNKDYYLSPESIYRYFNPNSCTNRFTPREFIEVFADITHLTNEEVTLLLNFYSDYKVNKKC